MPSARRRIALLHPTSETIGYYEQLARAMVAGMRQSGAEAVALPIPASVWGALKLYNPSVDKNSALHRDMLNAIGKIITSMGLTDTFAINRARCELPIPPSVTHHCWVHDPYDAPVDLGPVGERSWMLAGYWTDWWGGQPLLPATDFGLYHRVETEWDADISFAGYMPNLAQPDAETIDRLKAAIKNGPVTVAEIVNVASQSILDELLQTSTFVSDLSFAERLVQRAGERLGIHFEPKVFKILITRTRCDLVRFAQRERLLRFLIPLCERRGWRLRLAGPGWELYAPARPYHVGVVRSGEQLARFYQRTKVNLQVNGDCNVHPRLMEALACGSLVLSEACATDDQPYGLRSILDADCAPTYRTFEELETMLEKYIENDARRREAVDRGGSIVREKHTYRERAAQILAA